MAFLNILSFIFLSLFLNVLSHVSHLMHDKSLNILKLQNDKSDAQSKYNTGICIGESVCVPHVQCPAHVRNKPGASCKTPVGRPGICCITGQNHTNHNEEIFRSHSVRLDPISLRLVARHSREEVAELRSKEARLLSAGPAAILLPGPATYGHYRNSRLINVADLAEVMDVASRALEIAIATKAFKHRHGITNEQLELGMVQEDLRPTPLGNACPERIFCNEFPERYRRIDGGCNNAAKPQWGTALTPYARLLPPSYQDGIWIPRLSEVHGLALASPRQISTTVLSDNDEFEYNYTLMLVQFGQYLSHEITQSIDTSYANGSAVSCCTQDGMFELPHHSRHYSCMPITIPSDDPFYSKFNQGCMNFVRSVLAPRQDCTLGYAQQMNKITHFIDGSSIYGSTPEQTGELRLFENGRLKVFNDFGRELLPLSKDSDACLTMEQGSACFTSGDTRTNQMVSLVALHTIFVREHNRIATELSLLNPHWSDEKLFLEARQIVIAVLQVVIYKEYLPALIGDVAMEEFQLSLAKEGDYSFDYDEHVEPSITNEFASAAFRFGHSTVDGLLKMYGTSRMDEMIAIPEVMFQPNRMRKVPFFDQLLSALTTEPMQKVDNNIVEALTRYLFRAGNAFGIDLAALNIQRGRDHGLRPYNDYRELIGLPRIKKFEEFGYEMSAKLGSVYASVNDIDLWLGGLLEEAAPGSIVGYTFRDIIADQFYRLKKGDKYFFENHPDINPGFFQPNQLVELRKASMSRLICDNSDKILLARQAPNAFRKPGVPGNEFVDCASSEIPRINLIFWQEQE